MQEWAEQLAAANALWVHDKTGEKFLMAHPLVMVVDGCAAAHIPIVSPAN